MVQYGVCRRPPLTPPTQRRNLEANFFSVSHNVVLARSLFIASPPPSRSSISDANSCKLPSSLCLIPHAPRHRLLTALAFLRGLDRTPSPSRTRRAFTRSLRDKPPLVVKLFWEPARIFRDYRYLFAAQSKWKLFNGTWNLKSRFTWNWLSNTFFHLYALLIFINIDCLIKRITNKFVNK